MNRVGVGVAVVTFARSPILIAGVDKADPEVGFGQRIIGFAQFRHRAGLFFVAHQGGLQLLGDFIFPHRIGMTESRKDLVAQPAANFPALAGLLKLLLLEAAHHLGTGRVATTVMVLIGLLWVPVIQEARGLYHYLQGVQGYLAPPIFVVFFFGVFMKRLNAKGCLAALIVGFAMGAFRLAIDTPVKLGLEGFAESELSGVHPVVELGRVEAAAEGAAEREALLSWIRGKLLETQQPGFPIEAKLKLPELMRLSDQVLL